MSPDMSWLVGCRLRHVEKKDFSWFFSLGDETSIATESCWRFVTANGIAVTAEDDGQQFGLAVPVDAAKIVMDIVGDQPVSDFALDGRTGDLTLTFGSILSLQFLSLSSGYESWRASHRSQEIVCMGGGKLETVSMRAPFQVLVIPFRRSDSGIEYAVLKRSDTHYWQFIAGGGEEDETPEQAAQREASEEAGIQDDACLIHLDSTATVPKESFVAPEFWPSHLCVIPEYSFAVDIGKRDIALSPEHLERRWVPYEEARKMLRWDSNRNALREINERLKASSDA